MVNSTRGYIAQTQNWGIEGIDGDKIDVDMLNVN